MFLLLKNSTKSKSLSPIPSLSMHCTNINSVYGLPPNFNLKKKSKLTHGGSNNKVKKDFGSYIIVKACNIEYKKPAYLEDELTIRSFVKSITKTSFFMSQIITKNNNIIVEAQVHLVFIDDKGKPVKIPDQIYSKFKPYFCDTIKT